MSTLSTNQIVVEYIIKEGDVNKAKTGFDKLSQAEKDAILQTQKLNQKLRETGAEGTKATNDVAGGINKVGGAASSIGPLIAKAFSIAAITAFAREVLKTTLEFDSFRKVIDFTSGSLAQGNFNLKSVIDTANRLGVSIESAVIGFKTLSGATSQSGITASQTRAIFENTTKAVSAFGLSADDAKGVFLALSQIISKGTVSSEELRGQIGERIPGAFAIAAKSVGKTEAEFNKLLNTGKIASKDFVIPFTEALGKMSEAASNRAGAAKTIEQLSNTFKELQVTLGENAQEGGYFFSFIRGLGIATNKVNELLKTTKQLKEDEAFKIQKDIMETYGKASDKALQNATNNTGKLIRAAEAQLRDLKDYKQQLVFLTKEPEGSPTYKKIEEDKKLIESNLNVLKAQLGGINQIRHERQQTSKQDTGIYVKTEKELKAEYDARLEILNLLTQIRKLEQDTPAGQVGADKALFEEKIKLQEEFVGKGLKIKKEEIDLTKAQAKKAGEDLEQLYKASLMDRYKVTATTEKDIEKARKESMDKTIKDTKEMMDELDRQKDEQLKKEEKRIKLKKQVDQELVKQTYELALNSANALFDIQSQYDQNAFKRKMKGYDEELRLAGDNVQKQTEIAEKRAQAEKEYQLKQFRANQLQAVANVVFNTAPIIAKYAINPVTIPLAVAAAAAAVAQIGFIYAQPVPEFAEGTKGKPFKGGKAIVGEIGKEWVVTTSGQVYETPNVATLVDLPKGSQVIPNKEVMKAERFMGSKMASQSRGDSGNGQLVERLISIENTLSKLPITSLTMDERGFTKKIQTKSRETTILNNRFSN